VHLVRRKPWRDHVVTKAAEERFGIGQVGPIVTGDEDTQRRGLRACHC